MKQRSRLVKLTAIAGCILVGAGFLLSGIGFAAMGFTLSAFSYPRTGLVQQDSTCYTEIPKRVEVRTSLGNVTIAGNQEGLQGPQVDAAANAYQISLEQDTLVVTLLDSFSHENGAKGWKWYQLVKIWGEGDFDATISLPPALLESVYVENDMGQVELSQLDAGKVTINASSGNVVAENIAASQGLEIFASMGESSVTHCSGGQLTVEGSMGSSTVRDCEFQEGSISSTMGDAVLETSSFSDLTLSNDMGACTLSQVTAKTSASCFTSMGNVTLKALQSPQIILSADAGNISGTLRGNQRDYQIQATTDMGSSNLKDQVSDGPNRLEVTTGMGNIDLRFTE